MTAKEAIIKSLEELGASDSNQITQHIITQGYFNFGGDTPSRSVASELGNFIRNEDSRVKRTKKEGKGYMYFLAKNEQDMNPIDQPNFPNDLPIKKQKSPLINSFKEKDLHVLLSSYLNSVGIHAKTIFHEHSTSKDNSQKWIHPDMVGVNFLTLKTSASQSFLKAIKSVDAIKMYSYEIKKEINTDYELKKCFFQAVSNSSWANYGYLVAFEISGSLYEEMERLNQSFGIRIIELKPNPFKSRVHFASKYKEIDFPTIDKLCNVNGEFEKLIDLIEKVMTAESKYSKLTEKELHEFCDNYYTADDELERYCMEKSIISKGEFDVVF